MHFGAICGIDFLCRIRRGVGRRVRAAIVASEDWLRSIDGMDGFWNGQVRILSSSGSVSP